MANPKITSKNLTYDTTLPPFLAALHASQSTSSGRHERAIARPRKARTAADEEEDAPIYIDAATNEVVSAPIPKEHPSIPKEHEEGALIFEEYEDDGRQSEGHESEGHMDEEARRGALQHEAECRQQDKERKAKYAKERREKLAAIGGARKRKAGKIVGGDDDDDDALGKKKKSKKQEVKGDAKQNAKFEEEMKQAGVETTKDVKDTQTSTTKALPAKKARKGKKVHINLDWVTDEPWDDR